MYVCLMLFNAYKTFLLIWQKFYSRDVVARPVTALQQFFSFICCYHHTAGANKHANSCDSYRCLRCCASMEHEWSSTQYWVLTVFARGRWTVLVSGVFLRVWRPYSPLSSTDYCTWRNKHMLLCSIISVCAWSFVRWWIHLYVPLLYMPKMSAHARPFSASRLATMFLSHSITASWGFTNFHRSSLLLPIVVSMAT